MNNKIRVLVIDYRPEGIELFNKTTMQVNGVDIKPMNQLNITTTGALIESYVDSMRKASNGIADYKTDKQLIIPYFPVFEDGSSYTAETYNAMRMKEKEPIKINDNLAMLDYKRVNKFVNMMNFDEIWLFGLGWFGFYESRYVGPCAHWVNSPGLRMLCKPYIIMGFNRERDYTQMLHSFAHRAENIISRKMKSTKALRWCYAGNDPGKLPDPKNDWEWYLKTVGTVHKVPGGAEYSQEPTLYQWLAGLNPEWWRMAVKC